MLQKCGIITNYVRIGIVQDECKSYQRRESRRGQERAGESKKQQEKEPEREREPERMRE